MQKNMAVEMFMKQFANVKEKNDVLYAEWELHGAATSQN